MTVRITEVELARDVRAVFAKIAQGGDVIIVREDHRPVAVTKRPRPVGRKISECLALAKAYEEKLGYAPAPDEDFPKDMQAGIDSRLEPIRNVWDE